MAEASAPASSANLGPGFDMLALALDLRCRVSAETSNVWSIVHHGPERFEAGNGDDAVLSAAGRMSRVPLALEVRSEIPLSRGLGSSAAALAAGAMAAGRAAGRDPSQAEVFELVAELEGHPDNAAAAAFGGLVAVSQMNVFDLDLSDRWLLAVAVPGELMATSEARKVLPNQVDMAVVSRSLGRVVALIEGLRTGDPGTLLAALGDELHEAPRAALNPSIGSLVTAAVEGGAGYAAWSGSGPSVLAFTREAQLEQVCSAMAEFLGDGGNVLTLNPDRHGVI